MGRTESRGDLPAGGSEISFIANQPPDELRARLLHGFDQRGGEETRSFANAEFHSACRSVRPDA